MHSPKLQEHRLHDTKTDLIRQLLHKVEQRMHDLVNASNQQRDKTYTTSTVAVKYHLESGGQRVRAKLAVHSGIALCLEHEDIVALASTAELLHNASLVHDDLQDQDHFRRDKKTVWTVFGSQIAICAGDLLLSAAYGSLAALQDSRKLTKLLELVHSRTSLVIQGQCADLAVQARKTMDVAAYETIAIAKSGALLSLPLELTLIAAGYEKFIEVARNAAGAFAVGYQIADDITDVEKDRALLDKPCALNIVFVFEADGHGPCSPELARKLGLKRLNEVKSEAKLLPNGSGDFLCNLAENLSDQL